VTDDVEFDPDAGIAARGGWAPEFVTRPSNPPVYLTTAFDLDGLDQLDAVAAGQVPGYIYTRDGNPNHAAFAMDVARLEGAEAGVACASGMGAMWATLVAHLRSGDHCIAARVLYGRTAQLLSYLQSHFGVEVSFVDANRPESFAEARRENTRLAIVETISNPLMEVADLPAIVAATQGIPLLVDSTFATPSLCKPIALGSELVFHSASKYLNGHGDVMLGVVVGSTARIHRIRGLASLFGVNANPMECWLASRGLRTLSLRMKRVSETATTVAEALVNHRAVERVYYPGLATHPTVGIGQRVLPSGCGGMLAFEIPGGRDAVNRLFKALHGVIPFSPTLADTRSTLSYPTGTSHKFMSAQERAACGIRDGLVRLSVGLEEPEQLIQELSSALDGLSLR
jgi:cystathionine beta-lyase/cystathionine gamma-synthase